MGHDEAPVGNFSADVITLLRPINVVGDQPTASGALFMSGAKLYLRGASSSELVSST